MTRTIDTRSLEDAIVRNCAPTLGGVMPANLFSFPGQFTYTDDDGAAGLPANRIARNRAAFLNALHSCQAQLEPAGIRLRLLVWRRCGALVYAYRPALLARYLRDYRAALPLLHAGYRVWDIEACLDHLAELLAARGKLTEVARTDELGALPHPCPCSQTCCAAAFPHEVGYFLGYPYADVAGFIEHDGQDFLLLGPWKVYANPDRAQAAFARIRACTKRCTSRHSRGAGLDELAVAYA